MTNSHNLQSRFSFHSPDAKAIKDMADIRAKCLELAKLIDCLSPECREKETAFTQLSFVMMAANSAIVQQFPIKE